MDAAFKLVDWEIGSGGVTMRNGEHRIPVLRCLVVPINEPARSERSGIDLAFPSDAAVLVLRDTLNVYLKQRGLD
jgi:hypothetical protein